MLLKGNKGNNWKWRESALMGPNPRQPGYHNPVPYTELQPPIGMLEMKF